MWENLQGQWLCLFNSGSREGTVRINQMLGLFLKNWGTIDLQIM